MALTKFNYNSFDVTSAASTALGFNASANGFATISPGSMTLIKTLTASSDSTLSFVDGSSDVVLDNTYPVYMFKYISMHPAVDGDIFEINFSTDAGSNYNVTKTTSSFIARHGEDDSPASVAYLASNDLSQSTSGQPLTDNVGADADQSISGSLMLFNPSSTTFVKHFTARTSIARHTNEMNDNFVAGYGNTTSAIDGVRFKFQGGNIDAGTIKLYGIKDS
jgi:hypothetical protein